MYYFCVSVEFVFSMWALWYFYALSENISITGKKKEPNMFTDFLWQIGVCRFVCVSDSTLVAGGGVRLWGGSLHVDSTRRKEKRPLPSSPSCWQSTRNLWLPHVPSPTNSLWKFFRRLNRLPRLLTRWLLGFVCGGRHVWPRASTFRVFRFVGTLFAT